MFQELSHDAYLYETNDINSIHFYQNFADKKREELVILEKIAAKKFL